MKDCTTCANRQTPFKYGYCRTMAKKPKELFCHMTMEQALSVEHMLSKSEDKSTKEDARKNIKWLNRLGS